MLGYSETEFYKTSCLELTLEEDKKIALESMKIVSKEGYIENVKKRCMKKDATIIETKMSLIVLPDTDNFLIIINDITQENQLKMERLIQEQQPKSCPPYLSNIYGNI